MFISTMIFTKEKSQMTFLNSLPQTFVKTFIRQVNMIKIIGIDIFDESKNYYFNSFKTMIILVFSLYMLAGMILYVVRKDEIGAPFFEVVSSISVIVGFTQALVKMSVLFLNRKGIREIINKIGQVWPNDIEDEEKLQCMRFWTHRLIFFGNVFFKAALVTLALFEILPLAMTVYDFNTKTVANYKFTIEIYFFHYIDSHYFYMMAYIYQAITCTMLYICIYISSGLLLVALVLDVSALLNLLKIDLGNIIPPSDSHTKFQEEENCDDIRNIVISHQKLLSIVDDINRIFGKMIFTQVSSSSIVICCYGFMALMADGMFLNYIAASLGVMFEIFIISYPGQRLVDSSLDIADAAYQCQWYRRSPKFRKYIAIIITRSQKPCHLSALGFSDVNLNMFSKVMSTSWSYLSLLNQMYGNL